MTRLLALRDLWWRGPVSRTVALSVDLPRHLLFCRAADSGVYPPVGRAGKRYRLLLPRDLPLPKSGVLMSVGHARALS